MTKTIYKTKIYGIGAVDVLKQAEIDSALVNGMLKIKLDKDKCLTVIATGREYLDFYIETEKSALIPSY